MYIKKNLEFMIKSKKISIRRVSKDSGVSIKTLSYLLNKPSTRISLNSINKLSQYFEVNLDDFVNKDISKSNEGTI
ncbi:MAG: helix-turn-helix transcriptional regulator [Anaerorhabdus sp.]|uniref:helix-turn-helix domain-containing protein n=2 Tax=Anaerorhabdus sp. TaxID=1872524 RepID=UPI002FC5CD5E